MKKCSVLLVIFGWMLSACGDFLEEQSNELRYARDCADLEELLIGDGYMAAQAVLDATNVDPTSEDWYYPWIHVMDDDVQAAISGQEYTPLSYSLLESFYIWQANPFNNQADYYDDPVWKTLYRHIAVTNVILNKVDEFTHNTEEDRNSVKGQCYFLRAAYYYLLVNFYANPYDPVTASRDLGVPIKISPVVEDRHFTRSTVDSVYNLIVSDLQNAITCLEGIEMPSYNRANEDAARLLLSRVYCYMGRWEEVPALCQAIIDGGRYSIDNLLQASGDPERQSWIYVGSPEIIFTQGTNVSTQVFQSHRNNATMSTFSISPSLEAVFDEEEGDCRKDLLCQDFYGFLIPRKLTGSDTLTIGSMTTYVSDCFVLRYPEVYLNMAEAYAMTDRDAEARSTLRELMQYRIANLRTLTESGEDLVKLVRRERRRELCFEGQRWFDLRRYAVSPKYPEFTTIDHAVFEHNSGTAENHGAYLGYYQLPNFPDGGWVLPIPQYDIEATEGSLINNERSDALFYQ